MKKQFFSKAFSIFLALTFVLSNSAMLAPLKTEAVLVDQLYYSSMEAPTFGPIYWSEWDSNNKWKQNANDQYCDKKSAVIKKDTGKNPDNITTVDINTTDYESLHLNFWYKIPKKLESNDYVKILWSPDGFTWNEIYKYSNIQKNNWTYESFSLPSGAENKSSIKIKFSANLNISSQKDEFRLDCVELTGIPIPQENTPELCSDEIDNDSDQLIDLDDPDCADFLPTLTVIKTVINDNEGTAIASDFTINITGTNVSSSTFPGVEDPGVTVTLYPGSYSADESTYVGYTKSLDPDCSGDIVIDEDKTCTITNDDIEPQIEPLTIIASKVVCDYESDLPNWGNGGPDITSNTASDYISQHPDCDLVRDWDFEWAYAGIANPNDNIIGPVGGDWNAFDIANPAEITDLQSSDRIWVREVLQDDYIPFSSQTNQPNNDNDIDSAEFYCHKDVLNYDNYDYINAPELGEIYYCVGFNAPIEEEKPEPVCGNEIIETGEECDPPSTTAPSPTDEYFCDQNCNLVPIYHSLDGCPENQTLEFIQSYQIHSTSTTEIIIPVSGSDTYKFEVNGTFYPTQDGNNQNFKSDAAYTTEDGWISTSTKYGIYGIPPDLGAHALLSDFGEKMGIVNWGQYRPDHNYSFYFAPTSTSTKFVIGDRYDDWFDTPWQDQGGMSDNVGYLTLDVFECKPTQTECDPGIELVMNGGFETPIVTNSAKWDVFPSGFPGLAWLVDWFNGFSPYSEMERPEPANLELQRGVNGWLPSRLPSQDDQYAEGEQYAELDTDWDGPDGTLSGEPASVSISQEIPTIIGETYKLTFDFSPRPGTNQDQNHLKVFVDDAQLFDISVDGSSLGNTSWDQHFYNFVATSSTTNIKFTDYGSADSLGTFLDNVSVRCNHTPVQRYDCQDGRCIPTELGQYTNDYCDNQCRQPETSTVTICKYNGQEEPLGGWNMLLKGDWLEKVTVYPSNESKNNNRVSTSIINLPLDDYLLMASEQYTYRPGTPGAEYSDAGYTKRKCPGDATYLCEGDYAPWFNVYDIIGIHQGWLGIMINDAATNWGSYFNSLHTYATSFVGYSGPFDFTIRDDVYSDNSGELYVDIYKGYAGETEEDGCIVFTDVPFGTYSVDEILKDEWQNVSGLGQVIIDESQETFDVINIPPEEQIGSLTVCKYEDKGDFGEPYEPGIDTPLVWQMRVQKPDQTFINPNPITSSSTGCFILDGLDYGQYFISELVETGYGQTYPEDNNGHTVQVSATSSPSVYFLNFRESQTQKYACDEQTWTCSISETGQYETQASCIDACKAPAGPTGSYVSLGTVLGAATEKEEESCGLYLLEYIKLGGDNNPEEVKKLQYFLNEYLGLNLELSGIYDQETYEAVKRFQILLKDEILAPWVEVNCLPSGNIATGYVYRTTQWKINMIVCPELNLPVPNLYDETCKYIGFGPNGGIVAGAATSTVGAIDGTTTTTSTTTPEIIGDTTTTVPEENGNAQPQDWAWVLIGFLVISGVAFLVYQTRQV